MTNIKVKNVSHIIIYFKTNRSMCVAVHCVGLQTNRFHLF